MHLFIDESGSINNHIPNNRFFTIALVRPLQKDSLRRAYKRFISSNYEGLKTLDQDKIHPKTGKVIKCGGKMFSGNKFVELKGAQFDRNMKLKFAGFFAQKASFELYYIKISNKALSDAVCEKSSRVFNYSIRRALETFIREGLLPDEDCFLQIDERNEKKELRFFLENYLNTELNVSGAAAGNFGAMYFDSRANYMIQIADVFSNLFYSHLQTGAYGPQLEKLRDAGILKSIFSFPSFPNPPGAA